MQLKYFVAICDFGTVSAAAEYLHVVQPSLSIVIKELEGEFVKRHSFAPFGIYRIVLGALVLLLWILGV